MGHRREVRRIGLDQDAVRGCQRGGGAQVVRVAERHDAAERQVRAEIERAARLVGAAGEAVEHGARWRSLVGERGEGRVPRVARVDHQRAVELTRETDLAAEGLVLVRRR
jgi:hypothetical protein